jgi:very-short-patch-repair endonuclease
MGFTVLRFTNDLILYEPDRVLQAIASALSHSPSPSPHCGEGAGG